jgi:hypothetical protein
MNCADGGAVDPAQHGKSARSVGGHDTGYAVEALLLHDGEGVDLGSQAVARVLLRRGILLEGILPARRPDVEHAAIAAAADLLHCLDGGAQERPGDLVGDIETVVRRVH